MIRLARSAVDQTAGSALRTAGSALRTAGNVARVPARLPEPRAAVRWGLRHGTARVAFRSSRVAAEPLARLIHDPVLRANPYPYYADLLRAAPVVPGSAVSLTARHSVVSACLRDNRLLSGLPVENLPAPARWLNTLVEDHRIADPLSRPSMLASNGPDHDRYRRLAMRAFTARAIEGLREHIEKVAAELLDHMAAKGQGPTPVDLIADYAEILPVLVIAEILGVPMDMRPQFRIWATDIVAAADLGIGYTPFRRSEKASRAMHDWMLQHQRRLRLTPGEDLFSRMVAAAQAPDAAVDDHGLVVNATLLLFAGFETTVNLIGNGLELMDRHPDQLATLKADPARWANAVEEILRFAPPVQNTFRYPAEDLVLEGVPLAKGHLLGLVLAGANRDPEVFQDPDRFDVTRDNAREHLTFGGGPHFCLGAALARMEGTIAMRALYDRFPDLHPAAALRRRPSRTINGIAEFPAWLQA